MAITTTKTTGASLRHNAISYVNNPESSMSVPEYVPRPNGGCSFQPFIGPHE